MEHLCREAGRTVRAALGGWGPTGRLALLMVVGTICWVAIKAIQIALYFIT